MAPDSSGAPEFSAGTRVKKIVGVDVGGWDRQALSAQHMAQSDSTAQIVATWN
jgi:hypothetical protein